MEIMVLDGMGVVVTGSPHSLSFVAVPFFSTVLPNLAQLKEEVRDMRRFRNTSTVDFNGNILIVRVLFFRYSKFNRQNVESNSKHA